MVSVNESVWFGRRVFAAIAAVSLLLCLCLAAMWLWYTLDHRNAWAKGGQALPFAAVRIEDGLLLYSGTWKRGMPYVGLIRRHQYRVVGFELVLVRSQSWAHRPVVAWEFKVPYWFLVMLTALLPIRYFAFRRRWRNEQMIRQQICTRCGYDLRATPDRCPECGTEAKATLASSRQ